MTDLRSSRPYRGPVRTGLTVKHIDALAATGSADEALSLHLINQVVRTLWRPAGLTDEQQSELLDVTLTALKALAPTDEFEGMMVAQMVAAHNSAMECLRRAMVEGQAADVREQNLKHAEKLMSIYARQADVLNKRRSHIQQRITIDHVAANSAGQAVAGNFVGRPANGTIIEGVATASAKDTPASPAYRRPTVRKMPKGKHRPRDPNR